ncbi:MULTISPECIES: condensation domain-containing protein [Sphingobacterium]|uniref:condensation domain-containing protein n=1 Tax=Sphingobacterium TaxID=28453 RepID=UPI001052AC4C|nr:MULTISPECIES: condensation domain-containing protein [Sphingobacterium]MCW2262827.1 NRPS condensation-like uncharacterized protein [Sphingobacterium kitahiroshimense]NJI73776.1 hypothetical protein [Sphingobacterium sp. B16(2022)]
MIKRKLLMVERIMYVDSTTPLNAVFTAKIKGELSEAQIHTALVKIQKKHALLRATIDNSNEKQPLFVEQKNIDSIPLRIIERKTDQDWLTESEKEWYRLFVEKNKPLAQLVWLKSDCVSEILWVMPHCICDGTTIANLMREFLCLLDDPSLSLETYKPYQSIHEFLPVEYSSKNKKFKSEFYLGLARLFFLIKRCSKKKASDANYALHWKLDLQTTNQIIKKCKTNGISVHTFICAVFMQAFQQIQGKSAKGKVISPVDIRHFIPEIKEDHVFAFAPTVELTLKSGSLLENAKRIKQDLLHKINKMNVRELLWVGEQMHPIVQKMIAILRSAPGGHDITLSNMGKLNIPDNFKNFELETLYSPTVAFPWLNPNTLVISTFKNQMDFILMSNADFLTKDQAIAIKDQATQLLNEPL